MGGITRGERNCRWIERYCRIPEGKDVGKPVKLRLWQRKIIKRIYDNPAGTRQAVISFPRKNGKGLALDTPIPTPRGWVTMGDLRAGDQVFGSDGKPTAVEFVSPIHTGLRCWRLTFSDGSSIVADEQHRWLTRHSYRPWAKARKNGSGNGGNWRTEVVTTPQIAESVTRTRKDGGLEYNHKIEAAPATESPDIPGLPIDPYVLGAWLGDGTTKAGTFTCGEVDLDEMTRFLSEGLGGDVGVARYGDRAPTIRTPGLGFQVALRDAGVLGNKHIPARYFDAGTSQRWSLLQGLMDTDGTVSRNGGRYPRASFTGTSERLCRDVWRLARSLGMKASFRERRATLNGRDIGAKYDVAFAAPQSAPVFRLERKQRLLPETVAKRSRTLTIVSCEEVESVPTVCIKVAAADSLFLAGHGCIPTHNTALISFLLLLHLAGPEAKPNSQLYSAAQSKEQAATVYKLAAKVVRQSPDLNAVIVCRDTIKELHCAELGTLYAALSAEKSTAHGKSPIFAVHDELGQVKGPSSELYDAVETGMGAHEAPLSVVISTQAPTDNDLLSRLIDEAATGADPQTILELYAAPMDADPWAVETLKACNPAWGDFLNSKEVLRTRDKAKVMPSQEPSYRNLHLNQRVEVSAPFVSRSAWMACGGAVADFDGLPVYAGLDLSETSDLTAFVALAVDDGLFHCRPTFWLPEAGLGEKSRSDRVPYDVWAQQGFIQTTPGKTVDYSFVAAWLWSFCRANDVRKIAFDRWNWRHLKPWLAQVGFTEEQLEGDVALFEQMGQGFQSMSPALRDLEADILNERLRHGEHPVLAMCSDNATVKSDPAGNRKLDKSKSSGRIDGMVALAMARSVAGTWEAGVVPVSPWDDPAFVLEVG